VTNCKQYGLAQVQTVALVSWLLGHVLLALNLKKEHQPLLQQGFFKNYVGAFRLIFMVFVSLLVTIHPFFHVYLKTAFLPISLWLEIAIMVIGTTCWIEIVKFIKKRNMKNS